MAPNRTAPPAETAAAPAKEEAAEQPLPVNGGFKAWLPLVVTVIVMPMLAYAMTTYVLLPKLQHGLGLNTTPVHAKEGGGTTSSSGKKESVTMSKLLVNVAGTMGQRYLLVSLTAVGNEDGFKDKITQYEPQLRDMACGVLAAKNLSDLEKPGARNLIRTELMAGFNNILGSDAVKEIYLTEFAIQ
jgi:flagellar basal body-associated protein FliL